MNYTPGDGVAIRLGGRDFVVRPLNLRSMKLLSQSGVMKSLATLSPNATLLEEEHVIALVTFAQVVLAQSKDNPKITADELEEALDVVTMEDALPKLMVGAGLVVAGAAPGKVERPTAPTSIGASSSGS